MYDLSIEKDAQDAQNAFLRHLENGNVIELTKKNPERTLSQNAYLHVILSYFALEYGERTEYVKQEIFKKIVNPDLFKIVYENEKRGYLRIEWKSTRDLTIDEMSVAITRFRDFSSKEAGIYIPTADEHKYITQIKQEVWRNKIWL